VRVLAASFVSPGQAFPVVGVALALRARGHDVVYWAPVGSDGVPKGFGFETAAAGRWRGLPTPGLLGTAAAQSPAAVVDALASTYFDALDQQAAEFGAVIARVRPDVVLCSSMMVGLVLAAEAAGVPCATVTPTTYHTGGVDGPPPLLGLDPDDAAAVDAARAEWRAAEAPAIERLAQARAGLGLGGRRDGPVTLFDFMTSPDLHLVPSTPVLELPRSDVPDWVHYVGPCAVEAASQFQGLGPPQWTGRLPRPAVLITGGTVVQGGDFVAEAAAAVDGVAAAVALTWMHDPARLHEPPRVFAARYLPMADVLPDVDAVVSNGGSGGAIAALAHGRPLVVVPGYSDQGDNAVRLARAGVAVSCGRGPGQIRAAVERVLGDPAFADRARALAADLAARGGAPAAAALVESLAGLE